MKRFLSFFAALLSMPFASAEEIPQIEPVANHLAFILLDKPQLPTAEALQKGWEKFGQENLPLKLEQDGEEELMMLSLGEVQVGFLALIDQAIPDQEAERHYEASLSRLMDETPLPKHHAHLLLTFGVDKEQPAAEQINLFVELIASVLESSESIGVYWGNASVTHSRQFFLEFAAEGDMRAPLFSGFSSAEEPDGSWSFLSLGMNQLGLPDVYLLCPKDKAQEYVFRLYDLLGYLADRGEAIPAGDTIGEDEQERIPVEYVKSPAEDGSVVMKVVFP